MKVLTLEELWALDIPEPSFVVDGMFVAGASTLFSARAKAGKGLFMLDVARCVAEGTPFLGREVKQGPVIYLALEEPLALVRDRIRKTLGGERDIPLHVAPLDGSFEGQTFSLEEPLDVGALRDKIVDLKPVMIVMDVFREMHESDENDSGDMSRVLKPPRQLAHEFNVAIVVTHHMNRDGRFRGSSAIPGAFDEQIDFRREDQDDEKEIRGLVTGEGRYLAKLVQRVEFDQDTHRWRSFEGSASSSRTVGVQQKILDVLNSTDAWLTGRDVASRTEGVSERSVLNELTNMRQRSYPGMQVRGTGKKNDPFLYHGIQPKNAETPHSEGGTKSRGGPQGKGCVDCGAPIPAGAMYCAAHGGGNGHAVEFDLNDLWEEVKK